MLKKGLQAVPKFAFPLSAFNNIFAINFYVSYILIKRATGANPSYE